MNGTLVQVDTRKRVSLGSMAHHSQYLVREESDGTIIFEPAVVLTQAERAFLSDPELVETLEKANAHPERRRTRERNRTT
ncbi:MAG: hypothetical protein EPN48_00630 [Microbacteriaceae bacterium]|nr:MAG: hypothetical protein EPN48_00630 [Microbacteriaceae bacterium]